MTGYGRQNERYRTDNCGKNAAERNNPTGEDEGGGIRGKGYWWMGYGVWVMGDGLWDIFFVNKGK